jgi:hypothetical protein
MSTRVPPPFRARSPARGPRLAGRTALLTALLLGLLTGCGGAIDQGVAGDTSADPAVAGDDVASDGTPDEPDADAQEPADPVAGPGPDDDPACEGVGPEVSVFFVRSGDSGIWVEPEQRRLEAPTRAVARGAMELLFGERANDPDLSSEAPDDVEVLDVAIRDRVLIVDVSEAITGRGAGSAQEIAFAEQFAHTGAAFDTVDAVQLWVEGEPVSELWGHLDWSQPIEPDPFALSPITVTEPAVVPAGVTMTTGELVFRGRATVFEATLGVRLLGPDGDIEDEGFVTASEGAPGRGSWEYRVTVDEPGCYTLEVSEDDPSDGEGRPPFVMTRDIEVTAP